MRNRFRDALCVFILGMVHPIVQSPLTLRRALKGTVYYKTPSPCRGKAVPVSTEPEPGRAFLIQGFADDLSVAPVPEGAEDGRPQRIGEEVDGAVGEHRVEP